VLTPNVRYDSARDFEPIGLTAHAPAVIVARKDFPAANLKRTGRRRRAGWLYVAFARSIASMHSDSWPLRFAPSQWIELHPAA